MTGENGSPVTPDWQPTPKPWPADEIAGFEPAIPENVVLGTE